MRHEEVQELLGVYAVDAIDDPAERAAVDEHLATCAECRAEVDGHRDVLARLARESVVADATWAAISAALAPPEAASAPATEAAGAQIIPFRPRRRLVAWAAPVAAAAAAVLITLAATGGGDDLGSPVRDAAVTPMMQTADVAGTVALYKPDRPDGLVVVDLKNVPAAPEGHHYEVWVLRPGDGEEMEPIGAFTPRDGTARLVLRLPGPGEYVAVDISVQEDGGSPEHSGKSLARALLS